MDKQQFVSELRTELAEDYRERRRKHKKTLASLSLIETGGPDEIIGIVSTCVDCGAPTLPDHLLAQAIEMAHSVKEFVILREAFKDTLPNHES